MATRVYVGRLPYRATERDIEKFFRGYGRISEIILKNGFGFVDFDELRDAEDAAHDLNGKELMNMNLIVEIARGTPRGRDQYRWNNAKPSSGRRSTPPRRESSSSRRYRIVIENLSSRVSTQDLKDLFRKCGDIVSADANGRRKNEGYVEFSSRSDAKHAVEKYDGYEFEGKKLRVFEEKEKEKEKRRHSRSRSRSRGKRRSPRSRSRSGNKSPPPKNSKSNDRENAANSPNGYEKKGRSHNRSHSNSRGRYSDRDKRSEGSKESDD